VCERRGSSRFSSDLVPTLCSFAYNKHRRRHMLEAFGETRQKGPAIEVDGPVEPHNLASSRVRRQCPNISKAVHVSHSVEKIVLASSRSISCTTCCTRSLISSHSCLGNGNDEASVEGRRTTAKGMTADRSRDTKRASWCCRFVTR